MKPAALIIFFGLFSLLCCRNKAQAPVENDKVIKKCKAIQRKKPGRRSIHVFVALCDNKYQGIVPVGKSIGNGQDPAGNLYWGCDNGVKTYFRKASDWQFVKSWKVSDTVLERLLFRHNSTNTYLLADAYDGRFIQSATIDFLNAAAGKNEKKIISGNDSLYFGGSSNLLAYIGHDGLMDFNLPLQEKGSDSAQREAIILACYSKNYFSPHLKNAGAKPLLWTTNLMAPEAYTLHDAVGAWILHKGDDAVREAGAEAYARFQKCSVKAARNLVVTGW